MWPVYLVAVIGTIATLFVADASLETARYKATTTFQSECERVATEFETRFRRYAAVLRGAGALFDASQSVDADEWAMYVSRVQPHVRYKGVHGLAFVKRVAAENLDAFVERTRKTAFEDFAIKAPVPLIDTPTGDWHYIIKYHEPYELNSRAIGLDLSRQPGCKAAHESAMRSGTETISGPVTLAQDPDGPPGIVMIFPVYGKGTDTTSELEREKGLVGWVATPISMSGWVQGMHGFDAADLKFRVLDRTSGSNRVLYTPATLHASAFDSRYSHAVASAIGGRTYAIEFLPIAGGAYATDLSRTVLLGTLSLLGTGFCALLTFFVVRAKLVAELGQDDFERENRALKEALEVHTLLSVTDRSGRIIEVNDAFCKISGYSREELLGQDHRMLNSGMHPKQFWIEMWRTVAAGNLWRAEVCNRAKDGSLHWLDSTNIPQRDANGEIERYISIRFDITEHRRVRAALEQAQQLQEETARAARIGGWEVDLLSKRVVWSEQVREIHGVDSGFEPDLETAINFYAPEDRKLVADSVRRAIDHGEPWDIESELIRADGSRVSVRSLGRAIHDQSGHCVKLRGAFQEITDQVEARRRLELMQDRYELAVDGTSDGLWDLDVATQSLWCSDQMLRLLGFETSNHEEVPKTAEELHQLIHPDDTDRVREAIRVHVEEGRAYEAVYRLVVRGCGYRWFHARGRSVLGTDGMPVRSAGSLRDIHEQHLAETRLDLATSAAQTGLWDWDLDEGTVYQSDGYFTMLGYEAGELPRCYETWTRLMHPDDLDAAQQAVQVHLQEPSQQYSSEHRMRCKDGSWRWIRAIGKIVERRGNGDPKRMIGLNVDIEDLQRARERAEDASKAKSDFLANMSHEIRTPLTAIIGYSEILSNGQIDDPAEAKQAARTIRASSSHLLGVINDVLDMSKIEAGEMSIESILVDPLALLDDVAEIFRPRAADKGISFKLEYTTAMPDRIRTDPTRLRQLLVNVVGNAIKFTEVGGVTVRIACNPDAQQFHLSVADTGIGMTAEQREVVARFEPFNQADASMTRRYGGTGLGLRISHAISEMLGGRLSFDSDFGKGSTFNITIDTGNLAGVPMMNPQDHTRAGTDAALSAQETKPKLQPQPDRPLAGMRVLLAEDGVNNQRLITFHLERSGAEVIVCEHGEEAVKTMEANAVKTRPDIILMDMQMPVMDGYDATRMLRAMSVATPIIAVTAHALEGDRQRCLDAGCDDYMTKPLSRRGLVEMCQRWLNAGTGDSTAA